MKTLHCLITLALALTRTLTAADVHEVKIGTLHGQMKYDVERFEVKPGASVRLTLHNSDEMQHNLLILTPGEGQPLAVAQRAWALGVDAVKKQFVPDGADVLFHTRVLDPQQSDTITFTAPIAEGDYPYVCTLPGHAFSMKGTMRVSKTASATVAVAAAERASTGESKHVHVTDEPKVLRAFIDGGSPRSIAVGLPGGMNFLYDAGQCYVRFAWAGMFLDVGPNVNERGGGLCKILGEKIELGDSGFPISIGERDARQVVKFEGYRVRGKDAPQFFFSIDGQRVTQTITAAPEERGLVSEFEFERDPGAIFFYVSPHGLRLSSSAGTWKEGRLELPVGSAKKFSVTIARPLKDGAKPPAKDP